jgi:ABC-type transporter Mla subunit MlaD
MSEAKEAWDRVGDSFGELGRHLKSHYEQRKDTGETQADREAVERALAGVRDAVNRAVDSVNGAVKDPEVRDGANRAVTSLADALSTSFGEVSHQVRDALRRDKGSGSAPTS